MTKAVDDLMELVADYTHRYALAFPEHTWEDGVQQAAQELRTAIEQALAEAREEAVRAANRMMRAAIRLEEQAQPEPVEWVDDLPRLVYEAIGEASMQWHPRPTGVFASSEASAVCDRLIADVRALYAAKEKT